MILWVKAAHIISVISWMAAMLYLPRLMVYHCRAEKDGELSRTLKIMERRLLKAIMTPAMIVTWIFGLWLAYLSNAWAEGWFVSKIFLVILLSACHGIFAKWVREFADDKNHRPEKFYRIMNEVPAVVMIFIVILVVVRPF